MKLTQKEFSVMTSLTPEDRARALLNALSLSPASRAASSRYLRSLPVRPGVRYWATSQPRSSRDYVGVQFYGEGVRDAERFARKLLKADFERRNPQTGQVTFAKAVRFKTGDAIDVDAAKAVKREIDNILAGGEPPTLASGAKPSFRALMTSSPLADAGIILPDRENSWREKSF
ncbi:MAG: hypothetical protein ACXW3D_02910 [Caulobacteraceae bacterium]